MKFQKLLGGAAHMSKLEISLGSWAAIKLSALRLRGAFDFTANIGNQWWIGSLSSEPSNLNIRSGEKTYLHCVVSLGNDFAYINK